MAKDENYQLEQSKVAVVVLTGRDDEDLAARALRDGAEDYLVKNQSDPAQLRRAVRYAVERAQAAERLRESERLFHQLADAMPQIVWAGLIAFGGAWIMMNMNPSWIPPSLQ